MIDMSDGSARFLSYIETLHPVRHADIYSTLETLLTICFVPLLEKLVPTLRVITPPPMFMEEDPQHTVRTTLTPWTHRGRVIQCVFELIEVRLDPNRPEFAGIEWDDASPDSIPVSSRFGFQERFYVATDSVAVGVHVVACDNLAAPPQLSLLIPKGVTTARPDWLPPGSITLHPQRTAVFAAAYEQRLGRFELQDRTKSGRLVLVKLHLIYPTRRSPSTADVPPLHRDWISEACIAPVVKAFGLPLELIKTLEAFVVPPPRLHAPNSPGFMFGAT
ncbi:hypothetical protein PINS_up006266 [Pythium insidiosum]|nr:hypothetical protein PINS_up006266 [Pythium insidiosum]